MPNRRDWTLPMLLLLTLFLYVLLHDLFGGTLFASSAYNSYTLQALAWRDGRLGLGQDYPWLELAIYQGDWYVSFPPVPSLVLLPLTLLFGAKTPDNLVIIGFALVSLTAAYLAVKKGGGSSHTAAFWAAFVVLGSNMLWICSEGGVWFLAQALNMALLLLAVLCAATRRRTLAMLCTALAVGCRPFSIFFFFPLLARFIWEDRETRPLSLPRATLLQWKCLIAPALVGLAYMAFNYARFRNPLEFGHTYLPEFNRGEPQFSAAFILRNLKSLIRPVLPTARGGLSYPVYEGFLPFVANPFFIVPVQRLFRPKRERRLSAAQWVALAAMLLNFLCLLMHRTFGGWQFGARYTVDLIPYAFLLCLPTLTARPKNWELWLCGFAVLFNLYGAIAMRFLYT